MIKKILYINNGIVFLSLLLALLAVLISPYQIYLIGIVIICFLLFSYRIKFLIPFTIFTYLTVSSDINDNIRIALNIFNLGALIYVFVKEYGLSIKKFPDVPKEIKWFFILTFSSMIFSTLFSNRINVGLNEITRALLFTIIIYVLYSFIHNDKDIYAYFNAFLISGLIISSSLLIEFVRSNKLIYLLMTTGYVTIGGFFSNNAAVGGLLAVSITINLIYLFLPDIKNKWVKPSLSILLFLQIIALLLTNSRAAIFAAFVSIIFILFHLKKNALKKLIILLAVGSAILFLLPQFDWIFDHYFRTNRIIDNPRYPLWYMAWQMIIHHPIFGVGPGMFRYFMYTYLPVPIGSWAEQEIYLLQRIAANPAHNFFLTRTSELGIFGLTAAIGLFVIFFKYGFKVIKKSKFLDLEYHVISVGIVGIGLGLLCRSFFESTGIFTNGWITRDLPFWLLFSVLIFMNKKLKEFDSSKIKS